MAKPRLLFADDEPGIRATLPRILDMHGFEVVTAGDVVEALTAIQSQSFDVLLTDLNIGEPGDGFTLVSAMRRTHPDAITIIITGYPAFETALRAIRSQVDDYLVKPTDTESLVTRIHERLRSRERHVPKPLKRLSYVLEENAEVVVKRFERAVSEDGGSAEGKGAASAELVKSLILQIVAALRADSEDVLRKPPAKEMNATRDEPRISLHEARLLRRIMYLVVQENLLSVDVSWLISDLALANELIDIHVEAAQKSGLAA